MRKGIGSRKSVRRVQRACDSMFELLESRQFLAADVLVEVVNGSLIITGDDGSAYITVAGTATPGELIINPGDLDTTVNGGTTPFNALGVTKDIRVDMMGGNDQIYMSDGAGFRDFLYAPGSGNKTVRLSNFSFSRAISVTTLDGNDYFMLDNTVTPARLSVDSGGGDDVFIIEGSTLSRDVRIKTGANGAVPSSVNINNSTIRGSVLAWHDAGSFMFSAGNSDISKDVRVTDPAGPAAVVFNNTTLGRHLKIALGTGSADNDHQVLLSNSNIVGNVTISSISTLGYYSFDGTAIGGGVLSRSKTVGAVMQFYNNSAVAGSIRVADTAAGSSVLVKGALVGSVSAVAAGDTQITLDNTFGATIVHGKVSVRSLTGLAQLTVNTATVEGLASVKTSAKQATSAFVYVDHATLAGLKVSAGLGAVAMGVNDSTLSRPLTVVGGKMGDAISLNNSGFGARVVLSTGDGNDTIVIENGAAPDQTLFVNGLVASLGAGDDSLALGTFGNPGVVLEGRSFANGGPGVNPLIAYLDPASLPLVNKNFIL